MFKVAIISTCSALPHHCYSMDSNIPKQKKGKGGSQVHLLRHRQHTLQCMHAWIYSIAAYLGRCQLQQQSSLAAHAPSPSNATPSQHATQWTLLHPGYQGTFVWPSCSASLDVLSDRCLRHTSCSTNNPVGDIDTQHTHACTHPPTHTRAQTHTNAVS